MPATAAPCLAFGVAKEQLAGLAGLPFMDRLARFLDLAAVLRRRGCRDYHGANQAFYPCGQIAQLLLGLVQSQVLPVEARQHGLRPLIHQFVRTVGRLTRSGRRLRLLFGRGKLRWDWLLHAGRKLEPA